MLTADFNKILAKDTQSLMPFAFTLTHNGEDAKDLLQDTIYRALSNLDKFNQDTNIKAWLFTIMRNIFINNYRKKARENKVVHVVPQETLNYHISPAYNSFQENTFAVKEIKKAIHQLPEIFKVPFVMYFEGYKYKEIAEYLNEPLGTVKSRIHFARKLLQEMLPGYSY